MYSQSVGILSLVLLSIFAINTPVFCCICPSIKRSVCTFGPSGNLVTYDNLCAATCDGRGFGVLARSACNRLLLSGSTPGFIANERESRPPETEVSEWLDDVKKEGVIWKKVNFLLKQLLDLASAGAPACVCPGFTRPACSIGPGGTLRKYDNLCFLKCEASRQRGAVFSVGTSCLFRGDPVIPGIPDGNFKTEEEEKTLNDWYVFMENEIAFYRNITNAMRDLFPENPIKACLPDTSGYGFGLFGPYF